MMPALLTSKSSSRPEDRKLFAKARTLAVDATSSTAVSTSSAPGIAASSRCSRCGLVGIAARGTTLAPSRPTTRHLFADACLPPSQRTTSLRRSTALPRLPRRPRRHRPRTPRRCSRPGAAGAGAGAGGCARRGRRGRRAAQPGRSSADMARAREVASSSPATQRLPGPAPLARWRPRRRLRRGLRLRLRPKPAPAPAPPRAPRRAPRAACRARARARVERRARFARGLARSGGGGGGRRARRPPAAHRALWRPRPPARARALSPVPQRQWIPSGYFKILTNLGTSYS